MNPYMMKRLLQQIEMLLDDNLSKIEALPDNQRGNKAFSFEIEIGKNRLSVGLMRSQEDINDWKSEMTKPWPPIPTKAWEENL